MHMREHALPLRHLGDLRSAWNSSSQHLQLKVDAIRLVSTYQIIQHEALTVNTPFSSGSEQLIKDEELELRRRLGAAIRAARLRRKLTQEQLATTLDTDPETVSRFERGVALPSIARLLDIASALEVTIASLLGASSPRITDEWDELQRAVNRMSAVDRELAVAVLRTIVNARS